LGHLLAEKSVTDHAIGRFEFDSHPYLGAEVQTPAILCVKNALPDGFNLQVRSAKNRPHIKLT
jgi:hypothetical protein